jgi:N-acetylmuramoyl-L-alanine amidase
LAQRTHLANALQPRLLVSIHMNTSRRPGESGPLVIYQKKNEQSKLAAELVQHKLNQVYGTTGRPVPGKKYYLLNHAECPAIIAELGYLTNDEDRARLTNPERQADLARELGAAIEQYLLR